MKEIIKYGKRYKNKNKGKYEHTKEKKKKQLTRSLLKDKN